MPIQAAKEHGVLGELPSPHQLGRTGFFHWREEESHSHTQTSTESHGTAKSFLRCGFSFRDKFLTLEMLVMAGVVLRWRSSHVASGGNQINLTTCVYTWGMRAKSMRYVESILPPDSYKSWFLTPLGFLNQAVRKGCHIWLKNKSYRTQFSIPIDDQVEHAMCATQHFAWGKLSSQKGKRQREQTRNE